MNPHLNLFKFFNSNDEHHLEDNLSRAFAICLKYDSVFLDKVLQNVLPTTTYQHLFFTDFPDYEIEIDLQNRTTDLGDFAEIIGVACSGSEVLDFEVETRDTLLPETDVCVRIKDVCILFEFKRTSENCAAQLKCQVEKVALNSPDAKVAYTDLSWNKIIKILLNVGSIQKQSASVNPFTRDLITFLEGFPADWFPTRRLANIAFPKSASGPNFRMLNRRLSQLKLDFYGENGLSEFGGTFNRLAIKVDFGWINEVNIDPLITSNAKVEYLCVAVHLGDTKGQGAKLFQNKPDGISEIKEIAGFSTLVTPYLKMSNAYGKGFLWICPTENEARLTHTQRFFKDFAGRCLRPDWERLTSNIGHYIDNWKEKCFLPNLTDRSDWETRFEQSEISTLFLSVGIYLRILIPYKLCQELDDKNTDSEIMKLFDRIIKSIQLEIEGV